MLIRIVKWLALLLLALLLVPALLIALFGWNWARAPLQDYTFDKTGRQLVIGGDLEVTGLGWPDLRLRARSVSFSNPSWASERQMFTVEDATFSVDLGQLLRRHLVFPEVRLTHPVVFLELAADGRKTWLLDLEQSDEEARIPIGRLTLDQATLGYDDTRQHTRIRAALSSENLGPDPALPGGVAFRATGLYKGLALNAQGRGDTVLALHDESTPYRLAVNASIGKTVIGIEGSITSLIKLTALDVQLGAHGQNLADLFPLIGVALPRTNPYSTSGRLLHSGKTWRYQGFTGAAGQSDIAGDVQIDTTAARPMMTGKVLSRQLVLADLGPMVGAKADSAPASERVLPDLPFQSERWSSVDADVQLSAQRIVQTKGLPFEGLKAHVLMKDAVLRLDPLDLGFAGGHLTSVITLDGRAQPIAAQASVSARQLQLARLLPKADLGGSEIGVINGRFELAGRGGSVGRILASSDGRVRLMVQDGQISRLLLEKIGLHLLEILQLKLSGDKPVRLRCGVADFAVTKGLMQVSTLVVDTDVSTITGQGQINLADETLDLTLVPKTHATSLIALRTPIYLRGTFSHPLVDLDRGRVLARGGLALGMAVLNPLLALIPLVEMGPGLSSDCERLIREAQAPQLRKP